MRYSKIESQIWFDEKFSALTHTQKLLFLYILTSPHSNIIGLYVLKPGYIAEDLNMKPKDLMKDLSKLIDKGLIKYDFNVGLVYIPNYLKYNPLTNPNQKKAANKILKQLPKSPLIIEFLQGLDKGLREVLSKGLNKELLKPETESETESELRKNNNTPSSQLNSCDKQSIEVENKTNEKNREASKNSTNSQPANYPSNTGTGKDDPYRTRVLEESTSTKRKNKAFSEDSQEYRLAKLLLDCILEHRPNFKRPNLQSWAKHIDLMLRVDKRTPEEIEEVIRWCQKDPFWQANILSTRKLREKFDQLALKMQRSKARESPDLSPEEEARRMRERLKAKGVIVDDED